MNLTLSQFFTHLLSTKNFYAMVANRLKRVEVPGLGTMAVGIKQGRLVLFYDPEFVNNVSLALGVFAVEHEFQHAIWDHIPRYLELLAQLPEEGPHRDKAKAVYQIAMDCAVNTLLRNDKYLPVAQAEMRERSARKLQEMKNAGIVDADEKLDEHAGLVTPAAYGLDEDRSYDFYQHELMQREEDYSKSQALRLGDIHVLWVDSEEGSDGTGEASGDGDSSVRTHEELQGLAQQIRSQIKQVLRDTVKEVQQGRGTIPSECEEWLTQYLAPPITPWWELLVTRVQATKRMRRDRGVSRPNRMLLALAEEDPSIVPALGLIKDPCYRVFFVVDTSGSMNTESLKIAASELTHLLRADDDMEVRYIQGDADVHYDELFHTGDIIPCNVIGRGGTDFDAYFEYMKRYVRDDDTCPDLVIVYTDGYAPELAVSNRLPLDIPVIWLLTPRGAPPQNYGEVITCDPSHNHLHEED